MSVTIHFLKQNHKDDKAQEQLAETYLGTSLDNRKAAPSISKTRDRRIVIVTILSLSLVLFSIVLFYIFSAYAVKVDITINRKDLSAPLDLLVTQKINIYGGASIEKGVISLINDGTKKCNGITIDLKKPMDLSNKYLLISILPNTTEERFNVILRDKNYRSYLSNILDVQSTKRGWQNFVITNKKYKQSVDVRNIKQIRLELQKKTLSEIKDSKIYIKKVALIDN